MIGCAYIVSATHFYPSFLTNGSTAYSTWPSLRRLSILHVSLHLNNLAAFLTPAAGWYLVRNWGNLAAVTIVRISYGLAVAFSTPVILIVQLVYIYRIYRLNPGVKAIWVLLFVLLCLVFIESAFGWRGSAFGLSTIPFTQANHGEHTY